MNRSTFHLFVLGALICTSGQLRADLTDLAPVVHAQDTNSEAPKKPAEQPAPAQEEAPKAPAQEVDKAPAKPVEIKKEPSVRLASVKNAASKIASVPTAAVLAVVSTLKAQFVAHPVIASVTVTVVAAAAIYAIVNKMAEPKKSVKPARR